MVIIRILGGFASQLGKYVFGYSLAKAKGTELVLDISEYLDGYFRPFMLASLDLPDCRVVNGVKNIDNLVSVSNGEELIEVFEKEEFPNVYIYQEEVNYNHFFDKYPQYRINKDSELLRGLKLKETSIRVNRFIESVDPQNAIAVHIRRGDFVTLGWQDDSIRYREAIGSILCENPNAKVVFFSNDIEWVKNNYGIHPQFCFVENGNGYIGDVEDFICLSMCKWKILSSMSGYSRYANYLGKNTFGTMPAIVFDTVVDQNDWIRGLSVFERQEGIQYYNNLQIDMYRPNEKEEQDVHVTKMNRGSIIQNTNGMNKEVINEFWKSYYQIGNVPDRKIVIVTRELYDRWKWRGLFLVANILARLGFDVLYVNVNMGAATDVERGKIITAKDMDNNDLQFEMFFALEDMLELDKLLSEWGKESGKDVSIYSDVLVCTNRKIGYIKRKTKNIRYSIKTLFYMWKHHRKCIKVANTGVFDESVNEQRLNTLGNIETETIWDIIEKNALSLVGQIVK